MKAGFVGLIGQPNSGKSTLMNLLVGETVSIVTAKPQTTRRRALGIVNGADVQAVFVDAPGLVSAQSGLNQFLREEAEEVISESDVLIAVLNIDEDFEKLQGVIDSIAKSKKPWVAVIHKTDLPQLHRPRILREKLTPLGVTILEGSSLTDGEPFKTAVLDAVKNLLPESSRPLFDDDLYTTSTTRELCAEIIRERCFENLHQEVPFGTAVKIHRFVEDEGPMVVIEAEVIVGKDNHRPIVIGRGGQVLKKIGTEARKEIVKLIGRKVFLDLRVSARPNWQRNPMAMKELGYVHGQA